MPPWLCSHFDDADWQATSSCFVAVTNMPPPGRHRRRLFCQYATLVSRRHFSDFSLADKITAYRYWPPSMLILLIFDIGPRWPLGFRVISRLIAAHGAFRDIASGL